MAQYVVIIEQDRLFQQRLGQAVLGARDHVVAAAVCSLRAAEELPESIVADVILANSAVAGMNGVEGVHRLLARFATAQIVILGSDSQPGQVIAALRAGADGYLPLTIAPGSLVRALEGMGRGEAPISRSLVRSLMEALRVEVPRPAQEDWLDRLSAREREVVHELTAGYSNAEIAQRLGVAESTVKSHVSNILRKTGSRSRFTVVWAAGIS